MNTFPAFVVRNEDSGLTMGIEEWSEAALPEGNVTVEVAYSSVNYKDGLAVKPDGKIVNQYPWIPGIDLAGIVTSSSHPRFLEGDLVLCTGYGLGVTQYGGYSRYARLNGDWLIAVPEGLTLEECMGIGTAGFTAALSVDRLIHNGLNKDAGPVLVTGATGGVGSAAIAILSKLGYEVVASTGKKEQQEGFLKALGASEVIAREELMPTKGALAKEQWAGVIDPVGGQQLAAIVKQVKYGGGIALSGMAGGHTFETTVFPFILRGVQLLGIDSVYCPYADRQRLWSQLAGEWKPDALFEHGISVQGLTELSEALREIIDGKAVGRTVIALV